MPFRAFTLAALFGAVILAGACGDDPAPTGLDAPDPLMHHRPGHAGGPGGGDDGGGNSGGTPLITLAGAMTAGEFGASVSENQRRITVSTGSGGPGVDLDFSGAHAEYIEGGCTWENEPADPTIRAAIAGQLLNGATTGGFTVEIDKRALGAASDGHNIQYVYDDPELGHSFRVGIFAHGNPAPTITQVSNEGGVRTFRVDGGVVRVWRLTNPARLSARLFCGNHDDQVTVTLAEG